MKLSKADRAAFERMFVHNYKAEKGPTAGQTRRIVCHSLTTNPGHIDLATLQRLEAKRLITYQDNDGFKSVFGVKGWDVQTTDFGKAMLEAEPDEGYIAKGG